MHRIDLIRERLEKALQPLQLKIIDESLHHAGHEGAKPGGESHFRIEIVVKEFKTMSAVARHRKVYEALGDVFDEGLHALEIHAKAPGE